MCPESNPAKKWMRSCWTQRARRRRRLVLHAEARKLQRLVTHAHIDRIDARQSRTLVQRFGQLRQRRCTSLCHNLDTAPVVTVADETGEAPADSLPLHVITKSDALHSAFDDCRQTRHTSSRRNSYTVIRTGIENSFSRDPSRA